MADKGFAIRATPAATAAIAAFAGPGSQAV